MSRFSIDFTRFCFRGFDRLRTIGALVTRKSTNYGLDSGIALSPDWIDRVLLFTFDIATRDGICGDIQNRVTLHWSQRNCSLSWSLSDGKWNGQRLWYGVEQRSVPSASICNEETVPALFCKEIAFQWVWIRILCRFQTCSYFDIRVHNEQRREIPMERDQYSADDVSFTLLWWHADGSM